MSRAFRSIRAVFRDGSSAVPAFDLLVAHARAAAFEPRDSSHGTVRSVSLHDPRSGITPFSAIAKKEHINFYLLGPILVRSPRLFEAAGRRFGPVDGNGNREYLLDMRHAKARHSKVAALTDRACPCSVIGMRESLRP